MPKDLSGFRCTTHFSLVGFSRLATSPRPKETISVPHLRDNSTPMLTYSLTHTACSPSLRRFHSLTLKRPMMPRILDRPYFHHRLLDLGDNGLKISNRVC